MSLRKLLEEHRSIAKKATPGPWVSYIDGVDGVRLDADDEPCVQMGDSWAFLGEGNDAAHIAANSPEVVDALVDVAEAAEKVTNPKNYRGDDYSFLMSKNVMGLQAAISHLEDVMGGAE